MKQTRRGPRSLLRRALFRAAGAPPVGLAHLGERGAGQPASRYSLLGSQGAPAGRAIASGEVSFWSRRASIRDHDQYLTSQ